MRAHAQYDPEADAIGVYFPPDGVEYVDSEEVAPGLTLDYDAQGRVVGLEILGVRKFLADRKIPASDDTADMASHAKADASR